MGSGNMNDGSFLFELFDFFLVFRMSHICKEMGQKLKLKAPKLLSLDYPTNGALW